MTTPLGLTDLNNANPHTLADNFRNLVGPGLAIGDYLNTVADRLNALSTATAAARTCTIAGTVTADDILSLALVAPDGFSFSYDHQIVNATSATTAADELEAALEADADFASRYTVNNTAGVLTITALRKGTAENATTFVVAKTGGGSTTFVAAGATLTGGAGSDDILAIID